MNRKQLIWTSISVIAIAAILAIVLLRGKKEVELKTAKVEQGNVQTTVTSTGYLQPVLQVQVGTQVSGVIEKLYVDFNSVVKKGQLLATLDISVLNEKLNQAKATLSAAKSALVLAQQTYNRTKSLYDQKAETQTNMESATNALSQAKTTVENARSNVKQAEINQKYAYIHSPIDGVVLNRAVDEGQTVAASFNTPTLFTIANDLTKMEVQANMDEADVGGLSVGQKCTFTVEAFPDMTFNGTITQIRINPVTTNNVVTYTVIVDAPNPEKKLYPGMTANITVITQYAQGLTVPMAALQFTPSADVAKALKITLPQPKGNGSSKGGGAARGSEHKKATGVWIQNADGSVKHQLIEVGINDGINTIVTSGLQQDEKVILSATIGTAASKNNTAASNPLIPRRPGASNTSRPSTTTPPSR